MKVPEDISIAAIDNTRACTEIHPCLTSAASDPEMVGEEAAKLLLARRGEKNGQQNTLADLVVPSFFHAGETAGRRM
jgi:LacI family transcriptional regulator